MVIYWLVGIKESTILVFTESNTGQTEKIKENKTTVSQNK